MLENEANILALTPDDICVFRLMGAVTDPFLKEKFLELQDPTVDVSSRKQHGGKGSDVP